MPLYLAPLTLAVLATVAYWTTTRGLGAFERRYAIFGLLVHALGTVAHVVYYLFVQGYGDMLGYFGHAQNIRRLLAYDFVGTSQEVARLLAHAQSSLPVEGGGSTGTTAALAGVICFFVGDSLYAVCLVVSIFAFVGQMGLYRAIRETVPVVHRSACMATMLFVPSVVFWTAGIQKEAFLIGFLGLFFWSAKRLFSRFSLAALAGTLFAIGGMALIKAYVLLPVSAAAIAWFIALRSGSVSGTVRVFVVIAALLGSVGMTQVFPEYDHTHLALEVQMRREAALGAEGGSNIDFGDEGDTTLVSQARHIPLALINMLARPTFIDVKNVAMALAAVELTFVFVLFSRVAWVARPGAVIAVVRTTPLLLASVTFIFVFGVGVGLATTNLGTLSRYRVPMMPFYVMVAVLLYRHFVVSRSAKLRRQAPRPVGRSRLAKATATASARNELR